MYRFQRDIARDEHEVERIFDSGVAEFLFPIGIYNLDMEQIRQTLLDKFRRNTDGYRASAREHGLRGRLANGTACRHGRSDDAQTRSRPVR